MHLNEKKIYDMVNRGIIPATKVTGKWMFPKELIDKWMLDSTHNGLLRDRLIIAGSDDPFLYRIINDFSVTLGNRAIVTYTNTSTRTSLELLNANRVDAACIHWGPGAGKRYPPSVATTTVFGQPQLDSDPCLPTRTGFALQRRVTN